MANILYRGSAVPSTTNTAGANNAPLTNDQIDKNFYALDSAKFEKAGGTISGDTTFSNNVVVTGNLTVNGTTTTINTTNLQVTDANIELGKTATPTDTTANGGGITLKGATDKTIIWDSTNANWTSSENLNIASAKSYKINNAQVLSSTTLGTTVVNSSLTKLGLSSAGFVKSDASGNLTVDTSTYALAGHTHYIGTTAVQSSSANQALTGIISVSTDASSTASSQMIIATGNGTSASSTSGALTLKTGATNSTVTNGAGTGNLGLYTGDSGTNGAAGSITLSAGVTNGSASNAGSVSLYGGNSTSTTSSNNGHIYIKAGVALGAAGTKYGGKVWIDGGRPATGGTIVDDGTVNIGTVVGSAGNYGTMAINIGHSTSTSTVTGTVKLPTVGTSGFVKLSAGGQLVADTTTYISSLTDTLATVTARGASTSVATTFQNTLTVIGTHQALDVRSTGASDDAGIRLAGGNKTNGWRMQHSSDISSRLFFYDEANSTERFTIDVDGKVSVPGTFNSVGAITENSNQVLHAGNYTSYSPSLTGSGASGSWGISVTGNAATATELATARTLTIGSTGKTFDGSANVSWTLAEIGAQASDADLTAIAALTGTSGFLKKTAADTWALDTNTYLTANQSITVSGDASGTGTTAITLTLANSGATAGSYGSGSLIPVITVDAKGRVTSITTTTVSAGTSVSGYSPYTGTAGPAWGSNFPVIPSNGAMEIGRYLDFHGISADGVDYTVRLDGGGAGSTSLNLTGSFIASGDVTAYSDIRLKSNVQTIENALDKTLKLRGVTYTKDGKDGIGVIAQEVKEILPQVVLENIDDQKTLSVAYGNMVGVLIEAIKELNAKVENLQNQLANK